MTDKPYNTFAQGLLIVSSRHSSFNSDFSGLPRRLPDDEGTIYATDKALKYCIRQYLYNNDETLFVWRRKDSETGLPFNIDKNYEHLFGEIPKIGKTKDAVVDKNKMLINILSCVDSRLFGFTYAGKTNISITGPIQLSYGIDKMNESQFYTNQIMSPYQNLKKKDAKQETLGNETKTLEAHYVYDFVINPNNLISSLEYVKNEKEKMYLQESDVELFKKSMCKGVSSVTSSSKIGSDSELFLFIEMKSEEQNGKIKSHILPLMKDLVKVDRKDEKIVIHLEDLFSFLKNTYKKYLSNIELYYDNNTTILKGVTDIDKVSIHKKHIVTFDEMTN